MLKSHPCLYDETDPHFEDADMQIKSKSQMRKALFLDRAKFKTLFNYTLEKLAMKPGTSQKSIQDWTELQEAGKFLKPFKILKSSTSSSTGSDDSMDTESKSSYLMK